MPKREIKTELVLQGENQFKKAMTDAANSIKVLNSEQKLAEAQFNATGDAQQYAADKARILREKIAEQQKAVEAAQAAVDKLKSQGFSPASKEMQGWTRKLNYAKTELTNLETQLGRTESELGEQGTAFDQTGEKADEYNEDLKRVGDGVDFRNTITAIDDMRGHLETVIRTTARTAKALWEMETGAGAWADELSTAAAQAGIDVETYQSWQYASRFIDTSVDTIISSRQKLLTNMSSTSEEFVKTFNELGVVTRTADGTLRDQTATFWDVVDALGRIEDETTRDVYAQRLLGRSARELNPLINAGSKAYEELAAEGREVAVVSQESVEALGRFDDANQKLQSQLEATQRTIQASLAEPFTKLSESISQILADFNDFLQSEEGQAALARLSEAASGLVDSLTGEVDFNSIVSDAAGAVESLTGALSWIADHGELVTGILISMGGAWAGLTVAREVLMFLQLMKGINWTGLQGLFGGAKGGAATGGGAGTGGGAAAAGGGLLARLKGWFSGAAGAAKTAVAGALPAAGGVATTAAVAGVAGYLIDQAATEANYGEYNRALERWDEVMTETVDQRTAMLQAMADQFQSALESEGEFGGYDIESIKQAFRENANNLLTMNPRLGLWQSAGSYANLEDGLDAEEIENILSAEGFTAADWVQYASDVVAGLAQGILDGEGEARDAAAAVGEDVDAALRETLGIESPSTVMAANGEMIAAGLAEGIYSGAGQAIEAAQYLAAQVAAALSGIDAGVSAMSGVFGMLPRYGGGTANGGSTGGAGGGRAVNVTLAIDKTKLGSVMTPVIDSNLGSQMYIRR